MDTDGGGRSNDARERCARCAGGGIAAGAGAPADGLGNAATYQGVGKTDAVPHPCSGEEGAIAGGPDTAHARRTR